MAVKAFTYQYLAYAYPLTPGSGQNITVKFCGVQLTCSSLAPIALYLRDLVILSLGQRWSLFVSFIFFVEARQKLVLLGIYFSGSVMFFLLTILQCLYSPILVRFLTGTNASPACKLNLSLLLIRPTWLCLVQQTAALSFCNLFSDFAQLCVAGLCGLF